MSWSDRTDAPLPPGHPDQPARRGRVSDLAKSLIRTWVPVAVGTLVAWLARRWGLVVSEDMSAEATAWLVAAAIAGYYYAARWLEDRPGASLPARAARWLGRWLLGGLIPAPHYSRK